MRCTPTRDLCSAIKETEMMASSGKQMDHHIKQNKPGLERQAGMFLSCVNCNQKDRDTQGDYVGRGRALQGG